MAMVIAASAVAPLSSTNHPSWDASAALEAPRAWRVAMLLFLSLTVHNFPAGLAVAASSLWCLPCTTNRKALPLRYRAWRRDPTRRGCPLAWPVRPAWRNHWVPSWPCCIAWWWSSWSATITAETNPSRSRQKWHH
jgi:hypothetical protein